jgi:3-oxoacyl-[acyl-carrier protein] reductase
LELDGKVAIVTGGASGIGRAVVERFAEAGAAGAVIADVDGGAAQAAAKELGGAVLSVRTDVSKPESVEAMVRAAVEAFGRIDILVNNAGVCPVTAWDDTTPENWNRVLDVNLTGAFLCTRAVIPVMRKQKYGRIIYVSSTAADVGSLVAHVAYGVSKAGAVALMKSVAKGFAGSGITANAVSPGTIDTPLTRSFGEETQKAFVDGCAMKRRGTPREVADAVLFLASDGAAYVTGQTLKVDGGFALR